MDDFFLSFSISNAWTFLAWIANGCEAGVILSILSPSSEMDVFGFLSLFVFFMGGVLARKGEGAFA